MGRVDDKVAIVTGAGSGIGKATALLLAREGARVVAADMTGAEQETAGAIGEGAFAVHVDVSKAIDVEAMIAAAVSRFGRLDVIFNNAGIEGPQAPTADCTEETFDRVIAVNLKGVFLGMKYAIPAMLKNGGGSIINAASVAGLVGFPNLPAYCASKGGVIQLTKTAALEYATQNIRINATCPGVIWTPMVERITGGTEAGREQMAALEPVHRMGHPKKWPRWCSSWRATSRRSSRASRCPSTAASWHSDARAGTGRVVAARLGGDVKETEAHDDSSR